MLQARKKAEAAAAAAQEQLQRVSSRDHEAFEANKDSTDQGGDEGMLDADLSAKPKQEQVDKLEKALSAAQVIYHSSVASVI